MVKLTTKNMEQVIALADVQVRPCKKQVTFYNKKYDITGFEIKQDGRMVATYCMIDGTLRVIYPRGGEYSHTSIGGRALSYEYVLRRALNVALGEFEDALRRIND